MVWNVYAKIEELSGTDRGLKLPVHIISIARELEIKNDLLIEYVRRFQILDIPTYDDATCQITLN